MVEGCASIELLWEASGNFSRPKEVYKCSTFSYNLQSSLVALLVWIHNSKISANFFGSKDLPIQYLLLNLSLHVDPGHLTNNKRKNHVWGNIKPPKVEPKRRRGGAKITETNVNLCLLNLQNESWNLNQDRHDVHDNCHIHLPDCVLEKKM